MKHDDHAQMLVFESVFFAATVVLSLVFLYQVSPHSVIIDVHSTDLAAIGKNTLYTLHNDEITPLCPGYPTRKLDHYLITNAYGDLTSDLRKIIPSTIMYNINITNGEDTMFWCNSFGDHAVADRLTPGTPLVVVHCPVSIPSAILDAYQSDLYNDGNPIGPFYGYDGNLYEVQLQLWYI